MKLSRRLQCLLDRIEPGAPLADVGCDHALLAIAALRQERVPYAVATDRRRRPLAAARRRLQALPEPLARRLDLRLGEGLAPLRPQDGLATVVLAGVGSRTIREILDSGAVEALGLRRLVLQPQRSAAATRRDLLDAGRWHIRDEILLEERGEFYVTLVVSTAGPGGEPPYQEVERLVGRHLRRQAAGDPRQRALLARHVEAMRGELARGLERLEAQEGVPRTKLEAMRRKLAVLEEEVLRLA